MISSVVCMRILLLNALLNIVGVVSLRYGGDPLVPDYHEHYYYSSLAAKMEESMSINNCSIFGVSIPLPGMSTQNKGEADLVVKIVAPPSDVLRLWGAQGKGHFNGKLFAKTSPNLCTSSQYLFFKRGFYKRAKGCLKMVVTNKNGVKTKLVNNYGATLHPDHVRCDTISSLAACVNLPSNRVIEVQDRFRILNRYPFMVTANEVIVGKSGMIALPCGPFGLFSSCESVNWGVPAAASVVSSVETCRRADARERQQAVITGVTADIASSNSLIKEPPDEEIHCPFRRFDRVFMISQYDDTQIGQFMTESFPRLVYHLDFLYDNPDIKIHFGFTKQPVLASFALPLLFMDWLGLGHRLINGTVYARQAYMPREGGCQDPGYDAWEVVTMRERFIKMAGLVDDSKPRVGRPTIVVLTRSPSVYTQNQGDFRRRRWPKQALPVLLSNLAVKFPTHDVVIFSDLNSTLMRCPLCQVKTFRDAELVIGIHGAGLTNTMFMRKGSVVMEVVPDFDSRHAPIIGIFPRMSSIIGLHHYTYYIKDVELDAADLVDQAAEYLQYVKSWS